MSSKRNKEPDYESDHRMRLGGGSFYKMEAMNVNCGWNKRWQNREINSK